MTVQTKDSTTHTYLRSLVKSYLRIYLPFIQEKETHYGFLFFFYGDKIASNYNRGNETYFFKYYNDIEGVFTQWLSKKELSEDDFRILVSDMMMWVHQSSQEIMYVSLAEFNTFKKLKQQQKEHLYKNRLKLLTIISDNLINSVHYNTKVLSTLTTSFIKRNQLDIQNINFICYEVFINNQGHNKEDLYFYASGIISQLDNDYIHHPLNLTVSQLSYLFQVLIPFSAGGISVHEEEAETSIFEDIVIQDLLNKFLVHDQLHELVLKYKFSREEIQKKQIWNQQLQSNTMPYKIQKAINEKIFAFNQLHIILSFLNFNSVEEVTNIDYRLMMDYDGYFTFLAKLFLECGGTVKHVAKAYELFSLPTCFINAREIKNSHKIYTFDKKVFHDFYEVLFPNILSMFNKLKASKLTKTHEKRLANALLQAMITYNLNSRSDINHLAILVGNVNQHLENENLQHEFVLKNLKQAKSLSKIIALATQVNELERIKNIENFMQTTKEEAEKTSNKVDITLRQKHINMSSNMVVQDLYIDLYKQVLSSTYKARFFKESQAIEEHFEAENFNVGIYAHNNPIGVLGAGVGGVCISLNSINRLQQLNSDFMNLCIYNDKKVMLWGLLCRASNTNETVYILNNLQGSINYNSISTHEVRDKILQTLRNFVKTNKIAGVLVKDQFFNTVSLVQNQKKVSVADKLYKLNKPVRLDFKVGSNGLVEEEEFYLI